MTSVRRVVPKSEGRGRGQAAASRLGLDRSPPPSRGRWPTLVAELPGPVELEWAGTFEAGLIAMSSGRHDAHLIACRLGKKSGVNLLRAYREMG